MKTKNSCNQSKKSFIEKTVVNHKHYVYNKAIKPIGTNKSSAYVFIKGVKHENFISLLFRYVYKPSRQQDERRRQSAGS